MTPAPKPAPREKRARKSLPRPTHPIARTSPTKDEARAIRWWNALPEPARVAWLSQSGIESVADAWRSYKRASARSSGRTQNKPIAKSSKRIKVKPRTKAERERIYGTEAKSAWMRSLPCHFCGVEGFTQICHAQNGGMRRKDDNTRTFPACGPHLRVVGYYHAARMETRAQYQQYEGCHAKQPAKAERLRISAIYEALWQKLGAGVSLAGEGRV